MSLANESSGMLEACVKVMHVEMIVGWLIVHVRFNLAQRNTVPIKNRLLRNENKIN